MTATRRWVVGTAVAVVVILAAGWLLLVKPVKHKISNLHTQTAAQDTANAQLLTQISALQAEQKDLPQQQLILQKFATEVPDNAAEPALIRNLTQTAHGAGVDLSVITPGTPTQVGTAAAGTPQALGAPAATAASLYSLPLTLTVSGSYSNIESFFSGLEHLPRAFLVTAFTLTPAAATGAGSAGAPAANALSAAITTSVFYATGEAPPPVVNSTPAPAASAPPAATTPGGTTNPPGTTATTNPAASAIGPARHAAGETS